MVAGSSKIGMETNLNSKLHLSDLLAEDYSAFLLFNVHINSHIKLTEERRYAPRIAKSLYFNHIPPARSSKADQIQKLLIKFEI